MKACGTNPNVAKAFDTHRSAFPGLILGCVVVGGSVLRASDVLALFLRTSCLLIIADT